MKEAIGVYSMLVIAVISFIAPLIAYLLSMASEGMAIIRRDNEIREKEIQDLITKLTHVGTFDKENLNKELRRLNRTERDGAFRIRLLTPHRQIYRVFSSLFGALLFIMVDDLIKDHHFCSLYNHVLSIILISLSIICFIVGMLILRQVAWAVIRVKQMLAENKSAITLTPNEETP